MLLQKARTISLFNVPRQNAATEKGKTEKKGPEIKEGVIFPKDEKGERSTTLPNKAAIAASLAAADPQLAQKCLAEKDWRYGYAKYYVQLVTEGLKSPELPVKMAQAGIDYLYNSFDFQRGGTVRKFAQAVNEEKGTFQVGTVKGKEARKEKYELEIPYRGQILKGQAIKDQCNKWADLGVFERDAADAIIMCVDNPDWLDLRNDYFTMLGAGSAMGPLPYYLKYGANVIGVDLNRPQIWKRLMTMASNSSGSLIFPLRKPEKEVTADTLHEHAGANLISECPEIRNWISSLFPDKRLTIGSFAYLDAAAHVQVSLAMDSIVSGVIDKRGNGTTLLYLSTPTDCHVMTKKAYERAKVNWENRGILSKLINKATSGKHLASNVNPPIKAKNGDEFYWVNCLTEGQGPNYALAKRMQTWRCILARQQKGCLASINVAPITSTASVLSNATFKAAFSGMPIFKPMEIFAEETSKAVMFALKLHDMRNPKTPASPNFKLRNPLECTAYNAAHCGTQQCGFRHNSIGTVSVVYGKVFGQAKSR